MPEIYPKVTRATLKKGARTTSHGKGRVSLPGVKTDVKHVQATDKCGYKANRELAEMISKAVQAKKNSDRSGAVIMPPIIGAAMRCMTSEPAP